MIYDGDFFEHQSKKTDQTFTPATLLIETPKGKYEVTSVRGAPDRVDRIIFYFIIQKLYQNKKFKSYVVTTSRYEIAKNVFEGNNFGKNIYDRIMKSILLWSSINIDFEGILNEEDGFITSGFSMINDVDLKKSGELTIQFNRTYFEHQDFTMFLNHNDFNQFKKLSRDSSTFLYEELTKNFKDNDEWKIDLQNLATKLQFQKREGIQNHYPSDVLRNLKPAINEINKKTEFSIDFQYNQNANECIFKKLQKQKNENITTENSESVAL